MKNKQLIYTSDVLDYIKSFSNENNYTDGLNIFRSEVSDIEVNNEEELLNIASDYLYSDYETILNNLDNLMDANDCILYGTVGRWNGNATIYPLRYGYISEAIKKVASNSDTIYIYRHFGKIKVEGIHHDGTNILYISLLNDKGQDASDFANLANRCYHKAMDWTKLII